MSAWQVAAFLACVVAATCAQCLTGFALVLVLLGLTSVFALGPLPDAVNVATVLGLANAVVALRGRHRSLDWSVLRPTAIGTLFGVAAGVALLAWLSTNVVVVLRLLLGLVVIACAVIVLRRAEPVAQRSSSASFRATGFISGLLGGLFSTGGPPLVYQFYRQPMTVDAVRDLLVALLAFGSVLRLAMVVPTGQFSLQALWLSVLAVPVVMAVTWWMRVHPPAWRRESVLKLVCLLLVLTGLALIVPAVAALASGALA